MPGVEVRVHDHHIVYDHLGCEEGVQRPLEPFRFDQCRTHVEVDVLFTGMDPCVGPTRTRQRKGLPIDAFELRAELTCDGPDTYVLGEPTESAPVVGQTETDPRRRVRLRSFDFVRSAQTSSILAIGALSP